MKIYNKLSDPIKKLADTYMKDYKEYHNYRSYEGDIVPSRLVALSQKCSKSHVALGRAFIAYGTLPSSPTFMVRFGDLCDELEGETVDDLADWI